MSFWGNLKCLRQNCRFSVEETNVPNQNSLFYAISIFTELAILLSHIFNDLTFSNL